MGQEKILIIGSTHPAALELVFSKELTRLDVHNKVLGIQNIFFEYYRKSFWNKIQYRIGISKIEYFLQELIKAEITKYKPKIVLVFKGMEVTANTLIWVKSRGIKVVNYNPDSPFIFSGRGSGNKNVTDSISLYDIYFTYDMQIKNELVRRGVTSGIIPFGFDSNGFIFGELKKEDEISKLCFLGNADKFRFEFIQELAKKGIKIDVFGENWFPYKLHSNISKFDALYGNQFWNTLQKYAVQLNLLRPHNLTSHNMRSFDIPGAGGIMLAPHTRDHDFFFKDDSEVFLFKNLSDAVERTNMILGLNFEERQIIRSKARKESIRANTYEQRVKEMIQLLKDF